MYRKWLKKVLGITGLITILFSFNGVVSAITPNTWEQKVTTTTPGERRGAAIVELDGMVYLFGGEKAVGKDRKEFYSDFWMYNPILNTWTQLDDGTTQTVTSSSWTEVNVGPNEPSPRSHAAMGAANGKIYMVGGQVGIASGDDTLWEYDPAASTWTQKASIPYPQYDAAMAAVNGKIYLFGKLDYDSAVMWEYNPAANVWTRKAGEPIIRSGHTMVTINEKIYLFGGLDLRQSSVFFNDLWEYDPTTNTWKEKIENNSLLSINNSYRPSCRMNHGMASANEKIYIFGGYVGDGMYSEPTNQLWVYNPTSNVFTRLADAPIYGSPNGMVESNGYIYDFGSYLSKVFRNYSDLQTNYLWQYTSDVVTTGISASPSSVSIVNGQTLQLTVSAIKSDGTQQIVTNSATYASNDISVATVNSSGLITGVGSGSATINVSRSGLSTSVPVIVPTLPTPTGLTIGSAAAGSLTVAWNPVSGAAGYKLYRAASASGTYSQIASPTGTSYTNIGLTSNTTYYYKVRATNAGGDSPLSGYASGTTLNNLPSISLTSPAANQTISDSGTISVSGTASDPDGGNITISAAINGQSQSQTISSGGSFTLSWTGSSLGEGSWSSISVTAVDQNSGTASASYTGTIMVDTTTPAGSIAINNGDAQAESTTVTLTISASDTLSGVSHMMISNTSDFSDEASWEAYNTTRTWLLPRGDGAKTVYIKFMDTVGNQSAVYQDSISLQEVSAQTGDIFVTCDIDGLETGRTFSNAEVTITDLDIPDGWTYYGVDIGIFSKPEDYDTNPSAEWNTLFQKTIQTNSTIIEITDFGDITQYDFTKVYSIGYRVLYQPLGAESSLPAEGPWRKAPTLPGGYFKPYKQMEGITFNPMGGIYAGEVTVEVFCSDPVGLTQTKYAWSNSTDPAAIPAGDWQVASDPAYAASRKIREGDNPWYLHMETKNSLNEIKRNYQKYEIVEKAAAVVSPGSGKISLAGETGKIKLYNKQVQFLGETDWDGAGNKNIYTVQSFANGNTLFAGQDGKYYIRDQAGVEIANGVWSHGNQSSIKALAHVYKMDASGEFADEILMAGSCGKWQVINQNGSLSTTRQGDTDLAEEITVAGRQDGVIIMAGNDGKVKILTPEAAENKYKLYKQERWTQDGGNKEYPDSIPDTKHIYAVITLPDKSTVFAGQDGKIQRRIFSGYWQDPITWGPWDDGKTKDITTLTMLPNGNILMTGREGYYQVLDVADDYTLTLGAKGKYMDNLLTQILSTSPREDGRVIIAGNNLHTKLYPLETDSDITTQTIDGNTIDINTKWEGEGYNKAQVEWKKQTETDWSRKTFSGQSVQITGITPDIYDVRIRSLTGYPIYYTSETTTVETRIPVELTEFTDRITGANNWMTEADIAQGLNRYIPDSEVVSKLVIKPASNIQSYKISMDANVHLSNDAEDNNLIEIKNLRVARITIGESNKTINSSKVSLSGDTITYTLDSLSDAEKDKDIAIYFKYSFSKLNDTPLGGGDNEKFRNRASVEATDTGGTIQTVDKDNTIWIRDVKIQLR